MTLDEALRLQLIADTGTSGLLGSRIYPKKLPQKPTYPAVVYHRISVVPEHSHDGASDMATSRVQVDVLGTSFASTRAAAIAIRRAVDGFKGTLGGAGGLEVDSVFAEDTRDDYDDELEIFLVSIDLVVQHRLEA